jgi:outer membrane lipoprotein-sorting protein
MEEVLKCKTLQVQVEVTGALGKDKAISVKGRLAVAKGDKVRLELDGEANGKPKKMVLVSDGKKLRYTNLGSPTQDLDTKKQLGEAYRGSLSRAGVYFLFLTPAAPGQEDEFDPEKVFPISDLKLGKKEVISDSEAQVIEYKLTPGGFKEPLVVTVWVDVKTNLPIKRVVTLNRQKESVILTESYTKHEVDGKIDEKEFELPE